PRIIEIAFRDYQRNSECFLLWLDRNQNHGTQYYTDQREPGHKVVKPTVQPSIRWPQLVPKEPSDTDHDNKKTSCPNPNNPGLRNDQFKDRQDRSKQSNDKSHNGKNRIPVSTRHQVFPWSVSI